MTTPKAHEVLLTEEEWNKVWEVYPRNVPTVHPYLKDFAQLASTPQSIIEGANTYREHAWKCRCWMCNHMLAQPVITGFHLYIIAINKICAGGDPHFQSN